MRVSLLTCGPSVFDSWRGIGGIIVGVNMACVRFSVDWACFKDVIVPREMRAAGMTPFIGQVNIGGFPLHNKGEIENRNFENWDDEDGWMDRGSCQYTFPDALRWCLREFPDADIDIYGLDMNSNPCLGVNDWSFNHGIDRWDSELPWIRHLIKRYRDRITLVGCQVDEAWLLGD